MLQSERYSLSIISDTIIINIGNLHEHINSLSYNSKGTMSLVACILKTISETGKFVEVR